MAMTNIYQRWSSEWLILFDDTDSIEDVADEFPDAPIGSRAITPSDSAAPNEYMKFPSVGWVQTGGTFTTGDIE